MMIHGIETSRLNMCTRCGGLRGEHPFGGYTCTVHCRCTPVGIGEAVALPQGLEALPAIDLCACCALTPVPAGTEDADLFCRECRDLITYINNESGDVLVPVMRGRFLKTGRPLFPANKLQAHLFELGRRATLVRRVEQDSRRFYALRYLEQNPGMVLTATVLREVGKKTLLELQPLALQELVALRRRRPPGTVLRFEAIAADARADEVQLKEVT